MNQFIRLWPVEYAFAGCYRIKVIEVLEVKEVIEVEESHKVQKPRSPEVETSLLKTLQFSTSVEL